MTTPPENPNTPQTTHERDDARAALEMRLAERGLEVIRQDPEFAAAMQEDAELRALAGALAEIDAAMPLFEGDRVSETLREAVLADARIAVVRPRIGTPQGDDAERESRTNQTTPALSEDTRDAKHAPSRRLPWKPWYAWVGGLGVAASLLIALPLALMMANGTSDNGMAPTSMAEASRYDDDSLVEEATEIAWQDGDDEGGGRAPLAQAAPAAPEAPAPTRNRRPTRGAASGYASAPAMEPEPSTTNAAVGGAAAPERQLEYAPPPPAAVAPEPAGVAQEGEESRRSLASARAQAVQARDEISADNSEAERDQAINQPMLDNRFGSELEDLEGSLLRSADADGRMQERDRAPSDAYQQAAQRRDPVANPGSAAQQRGTGEIALGQLGTGEQSGLVANAASGSTMGLVGNGRGGGGASPFDPSELAQGQSLYEMTNQIGAFSQIQIEQNLIANNFVIEQQAVEGVRTQAATGYWQNTYVPGDPSLRRLADRVYADDAAYQLARGISAVERPFDPPTDAAIAVTAHGSRARTNGETRMVVQVGLQATERSTGRRPAMSIAVVLDLRADLTRDEQARVTALLQSLSAMQETGDRISLVVAGEQGGVWIEPGEFRYGSLAVAQEAIASGAEGRFPTESLGLRQALREGGRLARTDDDPNAPLGSSVVVLVTPERAGVFGLRTESLERDAHERAVDGIPTSVVSLAPGVIAEPLALAGGGQRWTLSSPEDAERVATGEIEAVSGIVARAVRLRIRLAPGVQLVDVLGSESLSEQRAERVREAEQAADQRISRSMGIASDRGEDEDGIQIVVPAFRVGDDHTVLLDVIVPGAGPVLDVTVRYKDLVHLRNGVAQTTFSVRSGDPEPLGPLELAVWEDVANFEVADRLNIAADSLVGRGGQSAAITNIDEAIALLDGLPAALPGFVRTHGWQDDRNALLQLRQAVTDQTLDPSRLADALRFAHAQKLYPMPGTSE